MQFKLEDAVNLLRRTPKILECQLLGLPVDWLFNNEGKNTWSPYDIVGHLIHGEKTDWMIRIMIILESKDKQFRPFDRFAQLGNDKLDGIEELLIEFTKLRNDNLRKLEKLGITQNQLSLKGIHPEFKNVTLRQLLATWVVHDLGHISQINRVLAKNYKQEVGPWINYLNVLNRQ